MTNTKKKIEKWELLKKEILSAVPKEYKLSVDGLDDDSEYFHPIIKVEDEISIKGQGDINDNDGIYAWRLQTNQVVGCLIYTVGFEIEDLEQVNKILTNWDKYKEKIKHYLEISKHINENIEMLKEIQNNIQCNLLYDTFSKENKKQCLDKLFKVKEWIENERIIEKYSGSM